MDNKSYFIRAEWDSEARVWVAGSEDVAGLVTEAQTLEELIEKLKIMVPELLEANGQKVSTDIPYTSVVAAYYCPETLSEQVQELLTRQRRPAQKFAKILKKSNRNVGMVSLPPKLLTTAPRPHSSAPES